MGNTVRTQKLSLESDLYLHAKRYSFEMATKILCHYANKDYGKETTVFEAPMRTISINSFHLRGTEIEKIVKLKGKPTVYIERLSLAGLNAPLPTPYAEILYDRIINKDFAFKSFLNTFNARLLGISYQISKKRFLSLQANSNKDYLVLNTLAKFFGEHKIDKKFARLSYLFWMKEKSADGLVAIIKYLYPVDVHIEQLTPVRLPHNNDNRLGHIRLGVTTDLGLQFTVFDFCITIHLSGEKSVIFKLNIDKEEREELRRIIAKYLGTFIKFYIYIKPKEVQPLRMKQILGRTTWIYGKDLQEARMLK